MLTKFALKAHVAVAKAFGDAVYQAASQTIDEIAARKAYDSRGRWRTDAPVQVGKRSATPARS